ncbi:unnamed protein product, partial [Choristocarpus tenellus]
DSFDLPDHVTYQMNMAFEGIVLKEDAGGLLGETSRPVLDEDGQAIMSGPDAFPGEEEEYCVGGALASL